MKNLINKIKEELKSQAAEQRFIKGQRKTEHLVGERKISSYDACEKARQNKYDLTIKYIAYYILKHRIEEPVMEDKKVGNSSYVTKDCSNMDAVTEAIKRCCGENCYLLKKEFEYLRPERDIAEQLKVWKEKYKDEIAESQRRLYVLIDKNLDPIYGCVQGGHAVAQYLLEHKNGWKNQYLIYLKADIEKWLWKLESLGLDFSVFKEPDIGNKMTALAVESDGRMFRNLKLVK